jgi:hypothetical protein
VITRYNIFATAFLDICNKSKETIEKIIVYFSKGQDR